MTALNRVRELVANEVGVNESEVTDNAHFINDLAIDMLDVTAILLRIAEHFGVSIPDGDTTKLLTVQAIAKYIDDRLG